jgi:hypothetical protein
MDLEDASCRARFLIRDRDGNTGLFDAVLKDAGVTVVLSAIQMPRMNAVMEGWVLTCRRELLGRTLIWNLQHLLHAMREFERFLQCPSVPPGNRQRPAAASATSARPRGRRRQPPPRPQT